MSEGKILVLGAGGYIGSNLIPELLVKGYSVRAGGRVVEKFDKFLWGKDSRVEKISVDVLDLNSLKNACRGCDIVYYLVHSMNPQSKDFENTDRIAAENMVKAAEAAGLKRIIYLGGLGDDKKNLSKHLRSRLEVSEILHKGNVPVTTFKAAMIIGKGSASFEILRHLVDRLPIMITPRWVQTQSQPIALENVIRYLVGCLSVPQTAGNIFDVGGPDILSYRELMDIYAEEAGIFKRFIIPIPMLTPTISSYWIQFVTPFPSYIARPLAEGLKNRVVCFENRIRTLIPQPLLSCRQAIRAVLKSEGK